MVLIGIDDTDNAESQGTNQLAKAMAKAVSSDWKCERIVRHQLLQDPRIPCTTRNGSASILLSPRNTTVPRDDQILTLTHYCREVMKKSFVDGSDPGFCVAQAAQITEQVIQFGYRCQFEIVKKADAIALADEVGIHLEGLGGTNGGMIGALAAVGLGASGNDGRVVQIAEFEDFTGTLTVSQINSLGVLVQPIDDDQPISTGTVTLDKKLRPSIRDHKIILFVQKNSVGTVEPDYQALRFQ